MSATGVINITLSRAVTLTVIALLEEIPTIVLLEYIKLLFNPTSFTAFGENLKH